MRSRNMLASAWPIGSRLQWILVALALSTHLVILAPAYGTGRRGLRLDGHAYGRPSFLKRHGLKVLALAALITFVSLEQNGYILKSTPVERHPPTRSEALQILRNALDLPHAVEHDGNEVRLKLGPNPEQDPLALLTLRLGKGAAPGRLQWTLSAEGCHSTVWQGALRDVARKLDANQDLDPSCADSPAR